MSHFRRKIPETFVDMCNTQYVGFVGILLIDTLHYSFYSVFKLLLVFSFSDIAVLCYILIINQVTYHYQK